MDPIFTRRCVVCSEPVPLDRLKRKGITCSADCARIDRLSYMKFNRHLRAPKSKAARGEAAHSVHGAIEAIGGLVQDGLLNSD